jgi:hypothetical protein
MSTQFTTTDTDEFVAVRWCTRQSPSNMGLDWGADHSRVLRFFETQPDVVDEYDHRYSWAEFVTEVSEVCMWTFGEFGGTFEAGSGHMATWEGMS